MCITNQKNIYFYQEKTNDILDLTDELDNMEEVGIYMVMKALYMKYRGEIRTERFLTCSKFKGISREKIEYVAAKTFMINEDGGYCNPQWDKQLEEIKLKSDKAARSAKARWEKIKEKENKWEQFEKESGYANANTNAYANAMLNNKTYKHINNTKRIINSKKIEKEEIPEYIDKQTWVDFVEMRKGMKAKPTGRAVKIIFAKLQKFNEEGMDPNKILEQSIENNYRGVFPLKEKIKNKNAKAFSDPFWR